VKVPLVAQEARTEVISPGVPAIEFDEPRLFGLNRILLVTDEIDKLAAVEVRSEEVLTDAVLVRHMDIKMV
jgi:hypothetical protein